MSGVRTILDSLPHSLKDVSLWPRPTEEAIPDSKRELYIQRKNIVTAYISNESLKNISEKHDVSKGQIVKLVKKCIKVDLDGNIYGLFALIPNIRTTSYNRKLKCKSNINSNFGYSGAFNQLLNKYPCLRELLEFYVLKKTSNKIHRSKISIKELHIKFIKKCRELGLEKDLNYPFNTNSLAKISLNKYVNSLIDENPRLAGNRLGSEYKKKLVVSDGTKRPDFHIYDRVECDAHKIDAIFCILVPSPYGDIIPMVLPRIWLIAVQDVCSRAILGYHLALKKEISTLDVIKAIRHASEPPLKIRHELADYSNNAGFPSNLGQEFCFVKWKEFSVDGAMANLSNKLKSKLNDLMGISPLVLKRTSKDDRPFVERVFKTFADRHFHQLPNTTGSNIYDSLRNNPEVQACKYFFQAEEISPLIDSIIANYNDTPHNSIGLRTPLEFINYKMASYREKAHYFDPTMLKTITYDTTRVTVRGNINKGIKPYIQFNYIRYTSHVLKNAFKIIGKNIVISFDNDEGRYIKAYWPDGTEIGILNAMPPWDRTPHSLDLRKAIYSLINKKKIILTSTSNPIETYLDYHEKRSKKHKKVVNSYLEAREYYARNFKDTSPKNKPVKKKERDYIDIASLPPVRKAKC